MPRHRRLSRWAVLFGLVVLGLAGGAAYVWRSMSQYRVFCNDVVFQQLTAAANQETLEAEPNYEEEDARNKRERLQWTGVISNASFFERTATDGGASRPFAMDGFCSSEEVDQFDAEFWSFRLLRPVMTPTVKNKRWARNPIDLFILARLEEAGLKPNAEASRQVLGRRLWFDLTGLPPTPDDIKKFVDDESPLGYEAFVQQLLSRPEFGERLAMLWLDVARYADSNGYEEDELRPHAYPYRDFIVWAMNQDLPYDLFVRWQIAGDELKPDFPLAVAATGFFTAAPYNTFIPQESERWDELDNMVSTLGTAMLGLSLGCARCHDHRYDAIPTRDYYGLVAIFKDTRRSQSYLVPDGGKEYRRWADPVDKLREEIKQIRTASVKEANISSLDYFTDEEKDRLRKPIDASDQEQTRLISLCERCLLITDEHLGDDVEPLPEDRERFERLMAEIAELELQLPTKPILGLTLTGSQITTMHVLQGGDLNQKGEKVAPGFLTVLTKGRPVWDEETWKSWSSGDTPRPRTALAHWITDPERGAGALLARVIVNRVWQHHFGQGLVRTPNDFGVQGDPPTHPQLLEWLAGELIDHGWRLKHIHRLILGSAAYRQAATATAEQARIDPENRLLGRRPPRRITAEIFRDAVLAVSGNLSMEMYGPGVKLPIPREAVFNTQKDVEQTWPTDVDRDRPALWRRSVYLMLKRTIPNPTMQLFDAPCGSYACGKRKTTTSPTQALAIWHAPFVRRGARRTAQRIMDGWQLQSTNAIPLDELVRRVFLLTVSRPPTAAETEYGVAFLRRPNNARQDDPRTRNLADLCHVMFMSNEFFYID